MTPYLPRKLAALTATAALALAVSAVSTVEADAASYHYKNCSQLQKHFAHGVGKKKARDKVSGSAEPVTTFKRSTKIYKAAIKYNRGLDRDHDGVACEKK